MLKPIAVALAIATLAPATASAQQAAMLQLPTSAPARFVGPTTIVAEWDAWERHSHTPAPHVTIAVKDPTLCLGHQLGCSGGKAQGLRGWGMYATSPASFYYELGHIFDWSTLTRSDRRYLARRWGASDHPWADTAAAIKAGAVENVGIEDGLEGTFALIYQDCAQGRSTTHRRYQFPVTGGVHATTPAVHTGRFNTCRYLRSLKWAGL
jgi:hypothetical protein